MSHGTPWHFLLPFVHLSRPDAISSMPVTRDSTTSSSHTRSTFVGFVSLLPGLRLSASRFGVDGTNATSSRKIHRLTKRSSTMKTFRVEQTQQGLQSRQSAGRRSTWPVLLSPFRSSAKCRFVGIPSGFRAGVRDRLVWPDGNRSQPLESGGGHLPLPSQSARSIPFC